ncbi:MAG: DUF4230 domain-containing protein [Clostridia bacterium]|nr:DUF4230 domain-containing protein [Clostridia bacterium]
MLRNSLKIILMVVLPLLVLCGCGEQKTPDIGEIRAISELATVECYYNNVGKLGDEGNFLQRDRKMWIEYEGMATIGIDMSLVSMKISGNEIIITLPEAKLLEIKPVVETLNENSYKISEDGFIIKNKITAEEQEQIIQQGQEKMEKAVKDNKMLFIKAEENAKRLIENYITELGKATGDDYQIKWKSLNEG